MTSLSGYTGLRGPTGMQSGKVGGYKVGQLQRFTPEQMQLFQEMFSQVSPDSYLSKLAGGDEQAFAEMEAPALRDFGALQGNIASRFSGMGGRGSSSSRRSSGFQNSLTSAGSNFAQDLASRRQGLQRQALMDLMGISNSLLGQSPYEQFLVQPNEKPSFGNQIMGGALPIAGAAVGGYFGGAPGAQVGYEAGNAAGQAFYS